MRDSTETYSYGWLPFPGAYQCTIKDGAGVVIGEGMGPNKYQAKGAAESNRNSRIVEPPRGGLPTDAEGRVR